MEKRNFYKYTTWALIVVNMAMVTFFVITSQNPPPPRNNMENNARDFMKMDASQDEQFAKLADAHKREMREINEEQRKALKAYFEGLTSAKTENAPDGQMDIILKFEKRKVESTYNHFLEIKNILNESQYAGFERFTKQALQFILIGQNKNGPPPKDR